MKNKFYKNLYQLIGFFCSMTLLYIFLIVGLLLSKTYEYLFFILMLALVIPMAIVFIIGFYWIFQKVLIDKKGIKIMIFNRSIKECEWNQIKSIEEANIMRNSAYRVILNDEREIHLDKRKGIKNAIELYSKMIIKK